ncbi:succinate dehydrogenase hydrophobic membrane anchor subunit [Gryllotalpicola ginsengisoli]|uniref:succinate dehydrogenase hydrophobic membrane anchor subunit n=1 Tax=Gryllotalpicola ginsengisoli TaxID=444608 RepID=UPI00048964D8|nr:succinate dehydrogenase hydrophobic membrane anchor subunit [Gryllotalpicola ginsengisoli]
MATIDAPRTVPSPARRRGRGNWEKWGWIYMRVSGVLLVILIFGHLFVNLVAGDGIKAVDFAFVAGKWASPFWRVWDGLMLWLALIHGGNGMRTLVNDYAYRPTVNRALKWAIFLAVAILIVLGTYTVTAFDPCPSDPSLSFCQ